MLRDGQARVTQIELFYDLVYVFAVTQLARLLVDHLSVSGAVQTAVLLAMIWQVWVYTTWMTTYLDPERQAVRLALIVLMLASLGLAAAVPFAFESRGLLVAVLYLAIQVGRSLFTVWALHGDRLRMTFWRAMSWSLLAAIPLLAGAFVHGYARAGLWALAVGIELVGAAFGFATPFLGHAVTSDWTIAGSHFAERCQAFVLIALGETLVVSGATLSGLVGSEHAAGTRYTAFVTAFAGTVALWWIYFDRAAADSAELIDRSDDPGRLGRSAFHWVHPLIVAGIIVGAAADEVVLHDPSARGVLSTSWLVVGGAALFLLGHAVFKAVLWRIVSWPRVVGAAVLLALLAVAPHVTALTLSVAALVVVVAVAVADRVMHPAALVA
ncbi:MAG TPA: low temperature requirement protein A [Jatrophihabitantaceae bacterium]|jgi:low temperature requirement protein LtrA